ncbi:MAG: hypothetical protein LC730_07355, partial [Acidobacteria bacterium]|nr:hypothetical protein [Acidobacteriota bacterium]
MTLVSDTGAPTVAAEMRLGIAGFQFSDLFDAARLKDLADEFYSDLAAKEPIVHQALTKYIEAGGKGFEKRAASNILTDSAPFLSEFIARIFKISASRKELERTILQQHPIWRYKFFVQRRAIKKYKAQDTSHENFHKIDRAVKDFRNAAFGELLRYDEELGIATLAVHLLDAEESLAKNLESTASVKETIDRIKLAFEKLKDGAFGELFTKYILDSDAEGDLLQVGAALNLLEAWSAFEFYRKEKRWASFKVPHALDYQNLVHVIHPIEKSPNLMQGPESMLRQRDGFRLTDDRGTMRDALYEVDYCLICHERDKDSCSTGLR